MVLVIDPACVLCNRNDESRDHLFFVFLVVSLERCGLLCSGSVVCVELWNEEFIIKTVILINNFMKKCYFLKFSILCYILGEIPF